MKKSVILSAVLAGVLVLAGCGGSSKPSSGSPSGGNTSGGNTSGGNTSYSVSGTATNIGPVGGATVTAYSTSRALGNPCTAVTDANGSYTLECATPIVRVELTDGLDYGIDGLLGGGDDVPMVGTLHATQSGGRADVSPLSQYPAVANTLENRVYFQFAKQTLALLGKTSAEAERIAVARLSNGAADTGLAGDAATIFSAVETAINTQRAQLGGAAKRAAFGALATAMYALEALATPEENDMSASKLEAADLAHVQNIMKNETLTEMQTMVAENDAITLSKLGRALCDRVKAPSDAPKPIPAPVDMVACRDHAPCGPKEELFSFCSGYGDKEGAKALVEADGNITDNGFYNELTGNGLSGVVLYRATSNGGTINSTTLDSQCCALIERVNMTTNYFRLDKTGKSIDQQYSEIRGSLSNVFNINCHSFDRGLVLAEGARRKFLATMVISFKDCCNCAPNAADYLTVSYEIDAVKEDGKVYFESPAGTKVLYTVKLNGTAYQLVDDNDALNRIMHQDGMTFDAAPYFDKIITKAENEQASNYLKQCATKAKETIVKYVTQACPIEIYTAMSEMNSDGTFTDFVINPGTFDPSAFNMNVSATTSAGDESNPYAAAFQSPVKAIKFKVNLN